MLTGKITGKNGTVKTGNAAFASAVEYPVRNWQFAMAGGTLDATDSESGDNRVKVPSKRYATSGSFEALHSYDQTLLSVNTAYAAHLAEDDTAIDAVYWSGTIVITDVSINTPIEGEDLVTVTYSFECQADWIKTDKSTIDITNAVAGAGTVTVTVDDIATITADSNVTISGVAGMTDLNSTFDVDSINGNDFVITLSTVQSYTSGGIVTIN